MPKIKKYNFKGEFLKLPEIVAKVGCQANYQTIYSRILRGMEVEKAIYKPVRNYNLCQPTDEWLRMGE